MKSLGVLTSGLGRKILKGADFPSSQERRPDTEEIVEPRHPISFYRLAAKMSLFGKSKKGKEASPFPFESTFR